MKFKVECPSFKNHELIPTDYTQEGRNISPPLNWTNVPLGTEEFALICEDPDAPGEKSFVHWIIYNLSPSVTFLPEGILPKPRLELPIRADQGVNSSGEIGWTGPLPSIGGGLHRYVFKLYALNQELGLPPGATAEEFRRALQAHIIDAAQLIGTYERGMDISVKSA